MSGMAFSTGWWLAPDLHGSGVARELVERIIQWSRSHGRARVVLSVERGNAPAARLYEKYGFVETDTPPPLPYEPRPGTRFYEYTL
jgi:RimJ/RimL family protein N-acetyltransferase